MKLVSDFLDPKSKEECPAALEYISHDCKVIADVSEWAHAFSEAHQFEPTGDPLLDNHHEEKVAVAIAEGKSNTIRHGITAAGLTAYLGKEKAFAILAGHEIGTGYGHDTKADLHNNKIGMKIGEKYWIEIPLPNGASFGFSKPVDRAEIEAAVLAHLPYVSREAYAPQRDPDSVLDITNTQLNTDIRAGIEIG